MLSARDSGFLSILGFLSVRDLVRAAVALALVFVLEEPFYLTWLFLVPGQVFVCIFYLKIAVIPGQR